MQTWPPNFLAACKVKWGRPTLLLSSVTSSTLLVCEIIIFITYIRRWNSTINMRLGKIFFFLNPQKKCTIAWMILAAFVLYVYKDLTVNVTSAIDCRFSFQPFLMVGAWHWDSFQLHFGIISQALWTILTWILKCVFHT